MALALALTVGLAARRAAPEPRLTWSAPTAPALEAATPPPPAPPLPWAEALEPLLVHNLNTRAEATVRLYGADGAIDEAALEDFTSVATDHARVRLSPRLMQLAVKAAAHFHAHALVVISSYRPLKRGKGGYHATGDALDFQLRGVDSRRLAAYLRSLPKVGVGVYTNPATQFVHLDVRNQSFHWLDASPPGRTWREAPLADPHRIERDATYAPEIDLPISP